MGGFLQGVIDAIYAFGAWLLGLVGDAFDALFTLLKNAVLWVFDGLLGVVVSAVSSVSFSIPSVSAYWSQVPADVINILSLVGFADCMAVIASALLVRITLQLIPFVRLGS